MVDISDVGRIRDLYAEYAQVTQAIAAFDSGGRIVNMTVVWGGEADSPGAVTNVPTAYINYPAQMVTAIRAAFETRQNEITNELSGLGVTGIAGRSTSAPARRRR